MKTSESIASYLKSTAYPGNQDLIDRLLKHGVNLELQVNVSASGGEPVHGKRNCYTDGLNQWFSFRIPKGAYTNESHWKDYNLSYNLGEHAESVGSTGWDWVNKQSLWVGFDFDTIVGHAAGVGIDDTELERVKDACSALDYVEVRRSTGGAGLHLYVFLPEGTTTLNHTEHAALARVILLQMSADVGFDLTQKVDVCGGNMWVAAKRASADKESFALIKAATVEFNDIPANWKDHTDVVMRRRSRVSVPGISNSKESTFDRLASAHRRVQLDENHIALRDYLASQGNCVWIQDHYLLQTHTKLIERAYLHSDLEMEGVFKTSSPGKDLTTPNVFLFPLDDGVWRAYRFGEGTSEHAMWEQDGKSWTTCYVNKSANLDSSAVYAGATKTKKGKYEFTTLKDAIGIVKSLSKDPNLDIKTHENMLNRQALVGKTPEGRLFIEVSKEKEDIPVSGWNSEDRRGYHTAVLDVHDEVDITQALDYDQKIRSLKTADRDAGWAIKEGSSDQWVKHPGSHVKMTLQACGECKTSAEIIMGNAIDQSWKLVKIPFADEYPGDRQWNRDAAQLRYKPEPYEYDNDVSPHPHFDMILQHIGGSLDAALKVDEWAIANGVTTGSQYLELYWASILKEPYEPLPYLFMYGPENSGKSIYHEAFSLLVTSGVTRADRALTSQNDFNGELEGCILAVVEEKNIGKTKGALNRIKEYVTAEELSIRRMRVDAYHAKNTTHWVQMSNDIDACPVFQGDSRIIALLVPEIQAEIPKQVLLDKLREEAARFTYTLLSLSIPPTTGRLRLPVIHTALKDRCGEMNQSYLNLYIDDQCKTAPGNRILYSEFFQAFKDWLPREEDPWTKRRMSKELAKFSHVQTVRGGANKTFVEGIEWKSKGGAK